MAASQSNPGKSLDWEDISLAIRPGVRARREALLKDWHPPESVVVSPSGPDIESQLGGKVSLGVKETGEWSVEDNPKSKRKRVSKL